VNPVRDLTDIERCSSWDVEPKVRDPLLHVLAIDQCYRFLTCQLQLRFRRRRSKGVSFESYGWKPIAIVGRQVPESRRFRVFLYGSMNPSGAFTIVANVRRRDAKSLARCHCMVPRTLFCSTHHCYNNRFMGVSAP